MREQLRVRVVENMACFTQIIVSFVEATKYFIPQIETEFLLRYSGKWRLYAKLWTSVTASVSPRFLCTLRECFNSAKKTVLHSAEPTKTNKQGPEAKLR